jgi:hypothetical protein
MTLIDRLAEYFRSRPFTWIDGRELGVVAGSYAWRTRCSDLRRPPYSMTIQNRQRRIPLREGPTVTISEYRYLPSDPNAPQPALDADWRSQRNP